MANKEQRERLRDELRKAFSRFSDSNNSINLLLTERLSRTNSELNDLLYQLFNYVDVLEKQIIQHESKLNALAKTMPGLKPVYAPIKIHELGEEDLENDNPTFKISIFDLYTFNHDKLSGQIHFLIEAGIKDKTTIEIIITEDGKEKSYFMAIPPKCHSGLYHAFKNSFEDTSAYTTLVRTDNNIYDYPVFKFTETKLEDIVKVINDIKQDCFNKEEILDL